MSNNTPFKDKHGKDVTVRSKIRIISTYSNSFLNGQEANVIWNEHKGMYNYTFVENRRGINFTTTDNFYGIHEFEIIG
jgi:hypothetical protein